MFSVYSHAFELPVTCNVVTECAVLQPVVSYYFQYILYKIRFIKYKNVWYLAETKKTLKIN